jgi:hypothetical protein
MGTPYLRSHTVHLYLYSYDHYTAPPRKTSQKFRKSQKHNELRVRAAARPVADFQTPRPIVASLQPLPQN